LRKAELEVRKMWNELNVDYLVGNVIYTLLDNLRGLYANEGENMDEKDAD